jgi:hypothetical protein
MKTTLKSLVVALAAFAIIGGISNTAAPAIAQTYGGDNATATGMPMEMGRGEIMQKLHEMGANHMWGMISSIQNDEEGQPSWIVAGYWMMEMDSQQNETNTTTNTTGNSINNITSFHAMLPMVMLDGSASHLHEISNFTLTEDTTFDSSTNSTTITGTSTITMREGPVHDVPTTIEIAQDRVIAISPDPDAVHNHYGDTPIYGIVITPEMIEEMMMRYGDKMGMMNMTGMHDDTMHGYMDGMATTNSSSGGGM